MWRSRQTPSNRRRYDCRFCLDNDLQEKESRHCFVHGEETCLVQFPDIKDDGTVEETGEEIEVDVEDFCKRFSEICKYRPENPLRVMFRFFGGSGGSIEICPLSIVSYDLSRVLVMAEHCERYHVLPQQGALEDQSNWLMEAFDQIAQAKAEFEKEELERMKSDRRS